MFRLLTTLLLLSPISTSMAATGPGCQNYGSPGCDGCACEDCVCSYDSWCCEESWDESCGELCAFYCGGCDVSPTCGDGVCDGGEWESCASCPEDCGCLATEACSFGYCCEPWCEDMECGSDGCGGLCGVCPEGEVCGEDETCVAAEGTCKECAPWQSCSDEWCYEPDTGLGCAHGGVVVAPECLDTPENGCCNDTRVYYCESGDGCPAGLDECLCVLQCQGAEICSWGGDRFICAEDEPPLPSPEGALKCEWYDCQPQCGDAECGDDYCGGVCGICDDPEDWCLAGRCIDLNSCEKRCDLESLWSLGNNCSCSPHCFGWGDCCQDVCHECAEMYAWECENSCAPNCWGRDCGPDMCGGECGFCFGGDACVDGRCEKEVGCVDECEEMSWECDPVRWYCAMDWLSGCLIRIEEPCADGLLCMTLGQCKPNPNGTGEVDGKTSGDEDDVPSGGAGAAGGTSGSSGGCNAGTTSAGAMSLGLLLLGLLGVRLARRRAVLLLTLSLGLALGACGGDGGGEATSKDVPTQNEDTRTGTDAAPVPDLLTPDGWEPGTSPCGDEDGPLLCVSAGDEPVGIAASELELQGGVTIVPGLVGEALYFDGTDGVAILENVLFQAIDITIEAWVRADGPQAPWAGVVNFWPGKGVWLGASDDGNDWQIWMRHEHASAANQVVSGEWQHIAGVFEYSTWTLTIYVNGREVHRAKADPPRSGVDWNLYFGGGPDSGQFQGFIDEIMIWETPRTAEEICADAGGQWLNGACDFAWPVGEVIDDPCVGIEDRLIAAAGAWRAGLTPEQVSGADDFVASYEAVNDAFHPMAEAWTVLAQLAIFGDAQELMCLGYLEAAALDPANPVCLSNASICLTDLGDWEQARSWLDCSLTILPNNSSALANSAYMHEEMSGDRETALDLMEQAVLLDPDNPEWRYQAMRLAMETGDEEKASEYLYTLPGGSEGYPDGYGGSGHPEEPPAEPQGTYCCPCDGNLHPSIGECIDDCPVSLACFINICTFSATCELNPQGLTFQLKICIPPSGLQVCFGMDTDGNLSVELGASVFNGILGGSVGASYNTVNGHITLTAQVGSGGLPVNPGGGVAYNASTNEVKGTWGGTGTKGYGAMSISRTSN